MYVVMYGFLNPLFLLNINDMQLSCVFEKKIVLDILMRLESPYI